MKYTLKILNWLSSLKVSIVLIILIALASGIGTALPQGEPLEAYLSKYQINKFLGIINGDWVIRLQLNHVYSSNWFLGLLFWLGCALIACTWRRQWPALKKAMIWIDYKDPKQIQKLAISKTFKIQESSLGIEKLDKYLTSHGWSVQNKTSRLAARQGLLGRVGPPLVHLGLILLMIGATFGVLKGERFENFLAPGRSIDLISPNRSNQLSIKLTDFEIERSPSGVPEQFRSYLSLNNKNSDEIISKEISVNHPLRFKGLTIYQADWALAAITIQINESPKLQLPLQKFNELGDQVWGVVIPWMNKENESILLTLSSEQGPIKIFNQTGKQIGITRPNISSFKVLDKQIKVFDILPSSGILIKYDPGVPFVYIGFAICLLGGVMSIISTNQLWVITEDDKKLLHIGCLSNRNSSGLANQLPIILKSLSLYE
ncbi:cytochrome c biogenesis protein ResB [Prochlorococcus marinus]|uniref:cytochrome c biogenesis protein ResB n=1 Tax=Prochlorococcus marinus TaxID=1219 RepID=UPI0022B2CE5A|nr:cytochrome c biogenesis protein ResB [Prochlorococcus marinus]